MASRQTRTLILCLFAVFAFSAVAASAASAEHVYGYCVKTEESKPFKEPPEKWDNHLCNTKVKPVTEREWEYKQIPAGTKVPIEVVEVVKPFTLKAGTTTITCEAVTIKEGVIENIAGPTGRDKGTVEFSKNCKSSVAGCTVAEPIIDKGKESALVEGATGKVLDVFTPEGWTEAATKAGLEKIKPFAKITQTGTGCVNTEVEGDGVAAEIEPAGMSETKILKFPCPAISMANFWNGVKEVSLKLKAFGVAAEECGEVKIALVSKWAWEVK